MMTRFFPGVEERIPFEGKDSKNPLAFRYYDRHQRVGTKTMAEHLRFSVAYWHTFMGDGSDMFGAPSFAREWRTAANPLDRAKATLEAAFEFFQKLGMDAFARGLIIAQRIIDDRVLSSFVEERYSSFRTGFGARIMSGQTGLADIDKWILAQPHPVLKSGRQEMLENIINAYV